MRGTEPNPTAEAAPLASRAARGGLWVALSSYFNIAFGFLANLALTRILAPEHFGIFALAQFFFSLLNLRPKLGLNQALGQRRETTGELIGTHLTLDVIGGLATLLLAALAAPLLRALGYSRDVTWVVLALAAVGVSDSLMGTAWVLLDRDLRFGRTGLVCSLAFPVSYLPGFWLALRGAGYWSLVAQNATYAVLLLVGMWWSTRQHLPHILRLKWRFDGQVARELLRFGALVGLVTLAGLLLTQFDNFLVGTFVGVTVLGYYDRAYRIAQWPSLLLTTLSNRTAFYTYARLQDDSARLHKALTMTLWLTITLALPLALAIFVAAPDLVSVLYGERWLPTVVFLRFLVAYSLLRPLLDIATSLFVAIGRPQQSSLIVGAEAATLIVVATPLTLSRGAVGTCIGVGLAFAVGLLLAYRQVRRRVALSIRDTFAPPAVSAALTVLVYGLLVRNLDLAHLPTWERAFVKGGLVAAMSLLLLLALERRRFVERCRYTWRLMRGSQSATPAS